MSHVTHMNESRHTRQDTRVVAHTWMRHVTHVDESCHTYKGVKTHTWMSHVTYESVMSHMNESSHV